jgi:hypothetical protein
MSRPPLAPYRVEAYNTARDSENKIHDEEVARRFGFEGGVVPGVDVYGYMTHHPVLLWGRDWLERGAASCRFLKPVYDGEIVTVSASETAQGLEIRAEARGELCAAGTTSLPSQPPSAPGRFEAPSPPANRPPADEARLAVAARFSIHPIRITREIAAEALKDLREENPIYRDEGLLHPGVILRAANWALSHNLVLSPWMHVGSEVQHFGLARIGDEISACAVVTANYEHKGHRFVDLEVIVGAGEKRPIARIAHRAIWRLREAA